MPSGGLNPKTLADSQRLAVRKSWGKVWAKAKEKLVAQAI
jgi:hypothetical protein